MIDIFCISHDAWSLPVAGGDGSGVGVGAGKHTLFKTLHIKMIPYLGLKRWEQNIEVPHHIHYSWVPQTWGIGVLQACRMWSWSSCWTRPVHPPPKAATDRSRWGSLTRGTLLFASQNEPYSWSQIPKCLSCSCPPSLWTLVRLSSLALPTSSCKYRWRICRRDPRWEHYLQDSSGDERCSEQPLASVDQHTLN